MKHLQKTYREWKEIFPDLCSCLICDLNNMIYEEVGYGTNTAEVTKALTKIRHKSYLVEVLEEMKDLISLIRKGKIDPDQFLEEIGSEKMYDYEHFSTLKWFEEIEKLLEENIPKRQKDPLDNGDFEG